MIAVARTCQRNLLDVHGVLGALFYSIRYLLCNYSLGKLEGFIGRILNHDPARLSQIQGPRLSKNLESILIHVALYANVLTCTCTCADVAFA